MASNRVNVKEAPAKHCVHHWIVEPAHGPISGARCRRCGEERAFFNNPDAVTEDVVRTWSSSGSPERRMDA